MLHTADFKGLEKNVYTSAFQDGLWDIYIGFLCVVMGIQDLLSSVIVSKSLRMTLFAMLVFLSCVGFMIARKLITIPRIGEVKFSFYRKAKLKKTSRVLSVSLLVGVFALAVAVSAKKGYLPDWWYIADRKLVAVMGAWVWSIVIFCLMSYFLDFARGYIIGVLFATGLAGTILFNNPVILLIAGILIMIPGIVLFIRFLRTQPVPFEEERDGER